MSSSKIHILAVLLFLFSNCSSDLDFDQVNDIEFTQEVISSIFYLNVDQSKFLNSQGTVEISEISDRSILDIFSAIYIQERLVKALFEIQFENTFDRNFEINIEFLDSLDQITQERTFTINQNSNDAVQFIFEENDLLALKKSFQIRVNITLIPSSSILDSSENMNLTLASTGTFTLIYN